MCGRSYAGGRVRFGSGRREAGLRRAGHGEYFGMAVEEMGAGAKVAAALSVLVPVVLSGVFLVIFAPGVWWIFTTYGWVAFPAFGLLVSGVAGLNETRPGRADPEARERELLRVLGERGEVSPAGAAAETSLTVEEADRRLRELAEGGHLEVRVRGGGVFYALWGADGIEGPR